MTAVPTHCLHLTQAEYVALLRAYASKETPSDASSLDEAARFALSSVLTPEEFASLPRYGVFVAAFTLLLRRIYGHSVEPVPGHSDLFRMVL